jgi:polysaccharide biosynthesis protein PslG
MYQQSTSGASCLPRIIAVAVLVASVSAGIWNMASNGPLNDPTTRPASAAAPDIAHTAVNPYSVNTFLSQEVEPWKREKTVEMISLAGIGWIKEGFPWSEIEPGRGSNWDPHHQVDAWQKYDEIVALAERYGIRVIARLDHTPPWARSEDSDYNTPPEDPDDFGRFVASFVERYRGRVQHIQIWNEPNLSREWGGEIDPAGYFELLRSASTHAREVDPNIVILSAPMAMTNERSERAIPEFDYWEELYELGADEYFDILTATGYGIDQPPEEEPDHDVINLRRIELLRPLMSRYGDEHKPIWLTEYGWNASPESIPAQRLEWGSVTPQQQADWTARGVKYMNENWDWFGVSSIWYFRQVGLIPPDAPEYYFAMVDLEFTPRLVYLSVKDDALDRRIAYPGLYAPLESPIRQTGRWSRLVDEDAPFGETMLSSTWGSEVRIEFSGTDLRILTGDLDTLGGRMYVTLNAEPAQSHLFEHDELGRTYLDLDRIEAGREFITVVDRFQTDRAQQVNTFVLHLHEDARFSISAVEVEYERTYQRFAMILAMSVLGIAGSVTFLKRGKR